MTQKEESTEARDVTPHTNASSRRKSSRRCPVPTTVRNWLIVVAIIAAVIYGVRVAQKNGGVSKAMQNAQVALSGLPTTVDEVNGMNPKQWGYAVGSALGQQNLPAYKTAPGVQEGMIDVGMVVRGFRDAITETSSPLMSEDMVRAVLEKRMEVEQKKAEERAQKNKEAGEKFLAEYKKKDGVKELENGVLYRVLATGTGPIIGTQDVKLHYRGTLIDGTEFDSSRRDGNTEPVVMSAKMTIPGFATALKAMRIGDQWEIVVPADQAYGEQGVPPAGIEPNSVLIFEVEAVELGK